MKITVQRNQFAHALGLVLSVVGGKATMPILSNVLIEAGNGSISLTTTNLDLGMRCRVKADVSKPGAITLPVRRLAGIVRELPHETVVLTVGDNQQVKITSGSSTFRIAGISKDEFPTLPSVEAARTAVLDQADLAAMLNSVSYAQSADETRYILNGVYFKLAEGKVTCVATDGRRLALTSRDTAIPADAAGAIILPAKAVAELGRLLEKGTKVRLSFDSRRATFEVDADKDSNGLVENVLLTSKVVEGNYPNYQQVIPKETTHRIKIERELLHQCTHRAALVCSEKANSVRFRFSANQLEITAQSPDFGEAHEKLSIAYSGPDVRLAFNPQFVLDPLKALPADEIAFDIKDEASPGVIRSGENFVCVIMPVRLS